MFESDGAVLFNLRVLYSVFELPEIISKLRCIDAKIFLEIEPISFNFQSKIGNGAISVLFFF